MGSTDVAKASPLARLEEVAVTKSREVSRHGVTQSRIALENELKELKRPLVQRSTYKYVVLLGAILSFVAGFVNVIFMLRVGEVVAHMTGTATKIGRATDPAVDSRLLPFWIWAIIFFIIGATISGLIIGDGKFRFGSIYGVDMMLQSVVLTVSYILLATSTSSGGLNTWAEYFSAYLACLSMGAQNAMVTTYSGAVLRTTHITGMSTDIGLIMGKYIRNRKNKNELWKLGFFGCLISFFIIGAAAGGNAFYNYGVHALLFPIIGKFLVGATYYVLLRFIFRDWKHMINAAKQTVHRLEDAAGIPISPTDEDARGIVGARFEPKQ